jgi:hypothetical protein
MKRIYRKEKAHDAETNASAAALFSKTLVERVGQVRGVSGRERTRDNTLRGKKENQLSER